MTVSGELRVDFELQIEDFLLNAKFRAMPGLTAFFGRSGSGKTTLVNAIAGLEQPQAGYIRAGNDILFDHDSGVNLPPERRRMGYIFQEDRLFPHLSVYNNLTYGWRFKTPTVQRNTLSDVVSLLDLGKLLDRRPEKLSGGERQRVAIGRAVLTSPELLLMDEPLASLDTRRKNEILPFIERLRDDLGIPIVYVSHDIDEVIQLADTMVVLENGHTVATGTVEEIMGRLDLRPLTGSYESGAVFGVSVAGHDMTYGLTELAFPGGGKLLVPDVARPLGFKMRMRIKARDVSLSLTRPLDTSILNIVEGIVIEIGVDDGSQIDVLLDVGTPLIARVTRKSVIAMRLKAGTKIFAMIKAVAIDQRTMGLPGCCIRKDNKAN